jgi:hypothetical protein
MVTAAVLFLASALCVLSFFHIADGAQLSGPVNSKLPFRVGGNFCGPGWCDGKYQAEAECCNGGKQCDGPVDTEYYWYQSCPDACCKAHDMCCGYGDRSTCNSIFYDCLNGCSSEDYCFNPIPLLGTFWVPPGEIWLGMKLFAGACCGEACPSGPPLPAPTSPPPPACDPPCAHNGTCGSGNNCLCQGDWAGPGCLTNIFAGCIDLCVSCFSEFAGGGRLCEMDSYATCKDSFMTTCASGFIQDRDGCAAHCKKSPAGSCLPAKSDCSTDAKCCDTLSCVQQSGMGPCRPGETGCYCDL